MLRIQLLKIERLSFPTIDQLPSCFITDAHRGACVYTLINKHHLSMFTSMQTNGVLQLIEICKIISQIQILILTTKPPI